MTGLAELWGQLADVGRDPGTGGYRRFAWTSTDHELREWFAEQAQSRGLDLTVDRAGNQWAWWGDPDARPGVAVGSHLDSVPDGGAFDGPLGVVSAFLAVDALRAAGTVPAVPIGLVNFVDEEGARFGVACAGSRVITGALAPDRAAALRDDDGIALGEAMTAAGGDADHLGRDDEALARVGTFVELHIEQGRALVDLGAPVGVARSIWPHGRWRFDFAGQANHAGTTALADRHDPMLDYAAAVLRARDAAARNGSLATFGKVAVEPNGVNAIPSLVRAWLDLRGPDRAAVDSTLNDLGGAPVSESWTDETVFDVLLRDRLAGWLGGVPVLPTGAGHDAGILAAAGVPAAMLFVRNPTGVSHSPAEHADEIDCEAGVAALTAVLTDLSAAQPAR
ncbi:MAG: allantoate amidohydrolase [Jatrophihabitans sp.]